jgi:hypothetical protein
VVDVVVGLVTVEVARAGACVNVIAVKKATTIATNTMAVAPTRVLRAVKLMCYERRARIRRIPSKLSSPPPSTIARNPRNDQFEPVVLGLNGPPPVAGGATSGGAVVVVTGPVEVVVVVTGAVVVVDVVDVVDEVVVTGGVAEHEESMTLLSRVTPPVWDIARPWRVTPVASEIDVRASTFPTNAVVVPNVAELPICHQTLHGDTPPERTTRLPGPVIRVLTDLKMNTEFASPTKVTVPVRLRPELAA